jgi:predicted unusual protein kinase regulating ubiquinone biosynthesis (AarF/ABC1/UbiB family)
MQLLAFEVLEKTRNLPFKLPQEAIYILRVSAIIEGLGTTYIENFNGIKDILPILQKNIPRALGAKESILETLIDEFSQFPLDIRAFRSSIYKISEENLSVELSKQQMEVIEQKLSHKVSSVTVTLSMMLAAIFLVTYDKHYENFALLLFGIGAVRLFFIKK